MAEDPAPSEQRHCKGLTEQKKPCQRVPPPGEEYCWQHKPKPDKPDPGPPGPQLPSSRKPGVGKFHFSGTQIVTALGVVAAIATIISLVLQGYSARPISHAQTLHYVFVVDSSARMASGAGGGTSKWSTIRASIENHLLAGLPPGASYSLLALGGTASETPDPCEGSPSQLVVPMKRNNIKKVVAGIDGLEPRGVASLEDALNKAREDLFRLPPDQHKALFLFLGGGDECDADPWTSLKYFLKDSGPLIDARIEIVILPGESVDDTVAEASEITALVNDMDLENVAVHTPGNQAELERTIGQIQENALDDAQKFEPTAVSQHRTALAEVFTPVANLQEAEGPEVSRLPAGEESDTPQAPPNSASVEEPSTPIPSPVNVPASTATPTPTSTPDPTPTHTPYLPTSTPTDSPLPVAPATNTPVPTQTSTPTGTPTQTPTPTFTNTVSSTPTLKCPHALPRQFLQGTASYSGHISIQSPGDCTTGHPPESPIDTHGTYSAITPGTTIWVLVYPENQLYYPQSPNACATPIAPPPTQVANGWSVSTYLGKEGAGPQWFDIVVVLADQEASNYLSSWLHNGCLATPNTFVGIDPDDLKTMNITEITFITVQTR